MSKPILAVFGPMTPENRMKINSQISESLKGDYHVLVLFSDKYDLKVFFEKDQVELDNKKLEELLAICNPKKDDLESMTEPYKCAWNPPSK